MGNKVHSVRELLIPLGIGAFSIFGICLLLLIGSRGQTPPSTPVTFTATPFKYLYLASPTYTPNPAEETSTLESSGPIVSSSLAGKIQTTPTQEPVPLNTAASGPPQSPTASTAGALKIIDSYDDQDTRLDYDGDWVDQTGIGDAHQGTLSVSNTIGSDIIFSFTGQQIIIGYSDDSGSGSMLILIDDGEFEVDQSTGEVWTSPLFDNAEHAVIIIHVDGGPINVDYINILGTE